MDKTCNGPKLNRISAPEQLLVWQMLHFLQDKVKKFCYS